MKYKKVFAVLGTVLLLTLVGTGSILYWNHWQVQKAEKEVQEERDKHFAYRNQSYAFCSYGYTDGVRIYEAELEKIHGDSLQDRQSYRDYSYSWEPALYCELIAYQYHTGTELTLEEVKEYLSQEYEEDGTLRIYTNSRNPTIRDFVVRHNVAFFTISDMHVDEAPEAKNNRTTAAIFEQLLDDYIEEHPEDGDLLKEMVEERRVAANFFKAGREIKWYDSYDLLDMDILREFGNKLLDPDYEIRLNLER